MRIRNAILAPTNYFFPGLRVKILPLLWAVLLFTFLQIPGNIVLARPALATAVSSSVGTIPGEFAVNGNGGANYTIPIEVPPGINGVQPNISLVYNSQQGNGLLGVGWQLAGFSAIARCGKMIATDGERGGVNFDSNDRFCFDGQRLMAVNGEYGANGTEYRTERETWVKVFSETVTGKNGPRSFTVITKDGHQIEFGKTKDSQVLASDGAIRVWAANKITDRNGNYVEVSYREDSSGQSTNDSGKFLGYYPIEIRYTGNSNSEVKPLRLVKFEYEGRDDKITAYVGGSRAETTKRLAKIKTYVDLDGKGNNIDNRKNLVKQYRLTYNDGAATKRSQLIKIKECYVEDEEKEICLPATELKYTDYRNSGSFKQEVESSNIGDWNSSSRHLVMDVNGDGLADLVEIFKKEKKTRAKSWISQGDGRFEPGPVSSEIGDWSDVTADNARRYLAIDFNGDGLSDLVEIFKKAKKTRAKSWISQGDGRFKPGPVSSEIGDWSDVTANNARRYVPIDVNGDGLTDLMEIFQANEKTRARSWISQGDGRLKGGPISSVIGDWSDVTAKNARRYVPIDVNGDGLTDLVEIFKKKEKTGANSWISQGDGRFEGGPVSSVIGDWSDVYRVENPRRYLPMDVNGDGLSDLVEIFKKKEKTGANSWISQGNGRFISGSEPSEIGDWSDIYSLHAVGFFYAVGSYWADNPDASRYLSIDVNGDGLSDLVEIFKAKKKTDANSWISQGNGRFISGPEASEIGDWSSNSNYFDIDVNGDGLTDLVEIFKAKKKTGANSWISQSGTPDLLATITNGIGGQTEIEYKPLTDKTVYTKGSGATYPKVDVQAPMFVVSKHTIKDNSTNPTNQFIYEHKYEGGKVDLHRGWLGFEKTTLIDVQNQTETITDFSTDFPLLGMMLGQEIRHNNQVLGQTTSKYESSKDSKGVYKIWKTDLKIDYYTERKKKPEYTLQKEYNYDSEYKNIILISDLADTDPSKDDNVYTCLSYYNSAENDWWKSFSPTQQKIVNSPSACNWESWNPETDLRWEKFEYDKQMNLISRSQYRDKSQLGETEGKWLVSKTDYDPYGNVVSITDPLGNTSTIDYESKYHTFPSSHRTPNLKKLSDKPLKVKSTYEPKFGIKTQVIDPNGHKTMEIPKNGIDGFGRILQVKGIKPNSNDMVVVSKTEFKQETNGISVKTWHRTQWNDDPNPNEKTWLWQQEYIDGLGRSYKTESKGFEPKKKLIDEVKFNAKGQVEKDYLPYYSSDKDKYSINYQYDVRGQVIQVTQPNGAVSKTDYSQQYSDRKLTYQVPDPRDDLLKNNLVNSLVEETTRGWVTEKIAPDESKAYYDYDRLGQVTKISGPVGEKTKMVYNALGQVLSEKTAETGTTKYTYNDNGKLVNRIDAKGQKISFQYDNLGRVIQKQIYQQQSDNNPTKTVTYQYDDPAVANSKGRLTKIIMPEGTYSFAYNNLGEVKEEKVEVEIKGTKKAFVTGYTYDAAGRPNTITYPDGSVVRHHYNYQGQLKTIELKEDQARNFTTYATYENYTALGNLGSVSYNNGVASEYQYDEIGRIKQSHTQKGSYSYLQFNYEWNKANKLLRIEDKTDQNLTETFSYNNVGRLIEATGPYGAISYNYDKAGNLIKRNDETFKYKRDKKHQLAEAEYDANGNTTAYSPWRYTYDSENRLLQVNKIEADSSKNVNKFTYDDSGIRLTKTEADGTTTYYVSPLYELVKQPSGAEVHTKYIVGPQGVVAAISKDGSNISLQNGLNYNSASLETGMYNLGNWGGFSQFFSAKAAQLVYFPNLPRWLFVTIFMTWLLFTLGLWVYDFCRSASRDSWVGKRRERLLQKLVQLSWLNPSTANQLKSPSLPSWLHGSWYRPWLFILGLVAFTSISLTGPITLAQLTPGSNGAGYPVAGKTLYFHHGHLGSTSLVTDEKANPVSQINYEPYGEIADSSQGEDNFRLCIR